MLFGVIVAAVSDIAQRELLLGIIEEAKNIILTLPLFQILLMKTAVKERVVI